jgi:hypothetical protein
MTGHYASAGRGYLPQRSPSFVWAPTVAPGWEAFPRWAAGLK